jgi:hypothetical protein
MSHELTFVGMLPSLVLVGTFFWLFRLLQAFGRCDRNMQDGLARARQDGFPRGSVPFDLSTSLLPLLRWLVITFAVIGMVPVMEYLTS